MISYWLTIDNVGRHMIQESGHERVERGRNVAFAQAVTLEGAGNANAIDGYLVPRGSNDRLLNRRQQQFGENRVWAGAHLSQGSFFLIDKVREDSMGPGIH